MDEYTPTMSEIKHRAEMGLEVPPEYFDKALAEHDRVVAANAWDEGYNVGGHAASGDYSGIYGGNGQEPPNPYRITEENN